MLRTAAASWQWNASSEQIAPWTAKAVAGFAQWGDLVRGQVAALTRDLSELRSFLPVGTRPTETIQAVTTALDAALRAGHPPYDRTPAQVEAMINKSRELDWGTIDRLERDLAKADSARPEDPLSVDWITVAARDRGTDPEAIKQFLAYSDKWLTASLQAAKMQESGAGEAAAMQVRELLAHWVAVSSEGQE
jgi:hypothetical protein